MKRFEYLEDVAIADIAFKTYGKTLNELFENTAFAVAETIADTKTIQESETEEIVIEEADIEHLLFKFIAEIIYLKDAEEKVFSRFEVNISNGKLEAKLHGESLNENIKIRTDVKAVTMHMLKISSDKGIYTATMVLDI